jgi:hypothetical protein
MLEIENQNFRVVKSIFSHLVDPLKHRHRSSISTSINQSEALIPKRDCRRRKLLASCSDVIGMANSCSTAHGTLDGTKATPRTEWRIKHWWSSSHHIII